MDEKMKTLKFPDGREVCALGQGTWHFGENSSKKRSEIQTLRRGLEIGMNLIDTSNNYGDGASEILVGEALKDGYREKCFLVTKFGKPYENEYSVKGVISACEKCLKRLQTETIDLFMIHWPKKDAPIAETLEGLERLVCDGKIKSWGVSNFDVKDLEEMFTCEFGRTCAVNEVLYNLDDRYVEFKILPWCRKNNIPILCYSPLGHGDKPNDAALHEVAEKHNATTIQIALAWLLQKENVGAIPKASKIEHLESNFKSLSIKLDKEDLKCLERNFPLPEKVTPYAKIEFPWE